MARKKDPVGQIVGWFQSEPLAEVVMLFKVLSGLVSARMAAPAQNHSEPAKAPQNPVRRGRGPNKPKVTPARAEPMAGTTG